MSIDICIFFGHVYAAKMKFCIYVHMWRSASPTSAVFSIECTNYANNVTVTMCVACIINCTAILTNYCWFTLQLLTSELSTALNAIWFRWSRSEKVNSYLNKKSDIKCLHSHSFVCSLSRQSWGKKFITWNLISAATALVQLEAKQHCFLSQENLAEQAAGIHSYCVHIQPEYTLGHAFWLPLF